MSDIILGIIGSGQLGSLLCQAAKKLNIKTVVISDDEEGPAQNYADQFIFSQYDNQEKVNKAENIEVLTISNLMGEAIKRISNSTSVSDLFK